MKSKTLKIGFSFLLIIISIIGCWIGYNQWQFYQTKPQSISNKAQNVFFYRSDCKDCKTIYPMIVKAKLKGNNIQCINLTSKENRKYIEQYGVVEVPTLMSFSSHHEYNNSWLGVQDIRQHLEKENGE